MQWQRSKRAGGARAAELEPFSQKNEPLKPSMHSRSEA